MGVGLINMRIAVLSGKGGTGKTLVAVNLAAIAQPSIYIDCDVEEPNGYLFLKPRKVQEEGISVKIPKVNSELCNGCRKCVDFCRFNALAYIKNRLMILEEVCHYCGGCVMLCPEGALTENERTIGKVQKGVSGQIVTHTGRLNPGEASGIPIIKSQLAEKKPESNKWTFVDCPPGSACIVMESIKDADYCILVAEPTLFGVHNLNMVYELVKLFSKPFGVVLNKYLEGENPVERFCSEKGIKILERIPFDHELATLNSNAEIAVSKNDKYRKIFSSLFNAVKREAQYEAVANS